MSSSHSPLFWEAPILEDLPLSIEVSASDYEIFCDNEEDEDMIDTNYDSNEEMEDLTTKSEEWNLPTQTLLRFGVKAWDGKGEFM